MDISHEDNGKKGRFFIIENNVQLAEMTYTWVNTDRIIIDHTEVDDALRGKNAGKLMVFKAVDLARGKNLKIIPLCPFAKSVFQKVAEINDVL